MVRFTPALKFDRIEKEKEKETSFQISTHSLVMLYKALTESQAPVIRTVYKTLEATFEGAIGGYKTVGKDDDEAAETTQAAPKKTSTSVKAEQTKESKKPAATTTTKETKAKSTSQVATKTSEQDRAQTKETTKAKETTSEKEVSKTKAKTTSTSVPSVISVPTETDLGSVLAKATGEASVSQTASLVADSKATNTQALVSATSTSDASSSSKDSSSSAGAKAGIAFGVLGGLLLVGMLVFFIFNRRKKAADRERLDDDEKVHRSIGGAPAVAVADSDAMSTRTDPRAPRISLRPVTQFLPNLNIDKRSSKGAAMALAPAAAAAGAVAGASAQNRGQGQNYYDQSMNAQNAHPANPFGNHAERIPTPIIEEQSMHTSSSPPSPVSDRSLGQDPFASSGQALAVAVPLARKASMRKDGPKQLDLTLPNISISPIPASPSGTEFSMSPASPDATTPVSAGAAAIAAAGGPANSPVHRVQLDFKPTLEDELELMAGQLVRILHEYDDGWVRTKTTPSLMMIDKLTNRRLYVSDLTVLGKVLSLELAYRPVL